MNRPSLVPTSLSAHTTVLLKSQDGLLLKAGGFTHLYSLHPLSMVRDNGLDAVQKGLPVWLLWAVTDTTCDGHTPYRHSQLSDVMVPPYGKGHYGYAC